MGCQASRPQVDGEGEALAFCSAAKLPQYAASFVAAGYDDRVTLASLTDDDLETVRRVRVCPFSFFFFFFSVGLGVFFLMRGRVAGRIFTPYSINIALALGLLVWSILAVCARLILLSL